MTQGAELPLMLVWVRRPTRSARDPLLKSCVGWVTFDDGVGPAPRTVAGRWWLFRLSSPGAVP